MLGGVKREMVAVLAVSGLVGLWLVSCFVLGLLVAEVYWYVPVFLLVLCYVF